jgi:hypothetical protein
MFLLVLVLSVVVVEPSNQKKLSHGSGEHKWQQVESH